MYPNRPNSLIGIERIPDEIDKDEVYTDIVWNAGMSPPGSYRLSKAIKNAIQKEVAALSNKIDLENVMLKEDFEEDINTLNNNVVNEICKIRVLIQELRHEVLDKIEKADAHAEGEAEAEAEAEEEAPSICHDAPLLAIGFVVTTLIAFIMVKPM